MKIRKLAIANRGEVACRIQRACRELGISTVLLHSDVDVNSIAYREADEAICIGPAESSKSYLNIQSNIGAALKAGADAIHPGFGFLSENSDFAQAVMDNNMIWVGPSPKVIQQMGDKVQAKKVADELSIPTIPGYSGTDQSLSRLLSEMESIGFPVIVKAAGGGGGRGLKVVHSASQGEEAILSAQREGKSAFANDRVFLEKYLDRAKHIEIQIFGDGEGRAVHLFERECSFQRNHQKIIEESPALLVSENIKTQLYECAKNLAGHINYKGAGTVEFLVQDNEFYFLEMNTRLQVEHPVTEELLGVDLVQAQIKLAQGQFELWPQQSLKPRGHIIEARLYAEDWQAGGVPSTGLLGAVLWPQHLGARFEVGFSAGDSVSPYYDSMVAKIIVSSSDRASCIKKLQDVLGEVVVFGVRTNIPLLLETLKVTSFTEGSYTTRFFQQNFVDWKEQGLSPEEQALSRRIDQKLSEWEANGSRIQPLFSLPWSYT